MTNRMPSKSVLRITWLILLIYLTVDFINNGDKIFFQLKYDWKNIKTLKKFENINIDTISHEYLVVQNNFRETELLEPFNTFSIKNNNKSFFRSSNVKVSETKIIFSGLRWINQRPEYSIRTAEFQIVNLPIIQSGNRTVTTIGDSQMIWGKGRDLRRNLSGRKKNIVFIGNEKDINGYPYEAKINATSQEILENLPNVTPVETYILFFGAHDKKTNHNIIAQNICDIFSFLEKRTKTEDIFVITLPPSTNSNFDSYNQSINEILLKCSEISHKIKIVNLYEFLIDKQDYLLEDQVHMNKKGYHLLNKLLIEQL